ncbi:MAG: B12-binding domain-containing radical SAM protein, partial [Oscillospiraceae bacterium]|nr:B12-binding domain-containing radical SAM protein [Oscillospiraceae bacterium]
NWHDAKTSVMEGVIARGDRRQGATIYAAWKLGCVFDGWDQCFSLEKWYAAFEACGLDPAFYASRVRPLEEMFPWDHIGCGTTKEHLKREWLRSRKAEPTVDCMQKCAGCGANALLEGGKCCV